MTSFGSYSKCNSYSHFSIHCSVWKQETQLIEEKTHNPKLLHAKFHHFDSSAECVVIITNLIKNTTKITIQTIVRRFRFHNANSLRRVYFHVWAFHTIRYYIQLTATYWWCTILIRIRSVLSVLGNNHISIKRIIYDLNCFAIDKMRSADAVIYTQNRNTRIKCKQIQIISVHCVQCAMHHVLCQNVNE